MTTVAAASLSSGLCDALDLSAFSLASRSIIIPLGPFPEADVGISCPHIWWSWKLPHWLGFAEVAYDADYRGNCLGHFHRRPDHPSHLSQHSDDARG